MASLRRSRRPILSTPHALLALPLLLACSADPDATHPEGDDPSTLPGGGGSATGGAPGTSSGGASLGGGSSIGGNANGGASSGGSTNGGSSGSSSGGAAGSSGGGGDHTGGTGGDTECTDVPPSADYTCEQQAGWGKCEEPWMAGFCELSCERCTPPATGGTGGAAGTGGTGGNGTGGGGPLDPNCTVTPVTPNASPQARKLLCYLYSIYGTSVLSGQQETSWSNPADDINFYVTNTGKYPAILGGDYLYPSGTTNRAIAYWNAGGIVMIRYHMGAPPDADSYESSLSSTNIGAVLTPGTNENRSFMQKLDYAAAELQQLEDAGVPVLWAPFHESQPNGWFWWSKGTGAQLVQMWRIMFDYYIQEKGLTNLLWLMPFSGSPHRDFYPGKDYVDLAGPDTYSTEQPFTSIFAATRSVVGNAIPIPLHETGRIPDPAAMFDNNAAPWLLFSVWAGYQRSHNSLAEIQRTYSHPRTITRDELPNLR